MNSILLGKECRPFSVVQMESLDYFVKADTVILERLSQDEPQPFVDSTLRHLEDFAAEGLRTFMYCFTYYI